MCRFIESVCCQNGKLMNLEMHQRRVDRTFDSVFHVSAFSLEEVIENAPTEGVFKCRVIYDKMVQSVTFETYTPKKISSLKLVESDTVDYNLKYENREALDELYNHRENCDDIIIVKNGYLTDAYYANIALFDGSIWYTPKTPLLFGTKRASYINAGILKEAEISKEDLSTFTQLSLINAMLNLEEGVIPVTQIL